MKKNLILSTPRTILRAWQDSDRPAFAKMNADPVVMRHFPSTLTIEQSERLLDKIQAHLDQHGFGLWALEIPGHFAFAGFVGLSIPAFEAHFTPCVEIGWRLVKEAWGKGYATEAAKRALQFGFTELELPEIVSFTSAKNEASIRVMQKIGMSHDAADDFDHPGLAPGHPLARHVLYRIRS